MVGGAAVLNDKGNTRTRVALLAERGFPGAVPPLPD